MKKSSRMPALLLALVLALSLSACGGQTSPAPPSHTLSIVWPTLDIDFYSVMADVMKEQAEKAGWQVNVVSYDLDSDTHAAALERCGTDGTTDIITCAASPDAIEEVCVRLRRDNGININFFSSPPDNPDAYDSATVADQYQIGEAIAQNASEWVDKTFPDAGDGSVDAVLIEMPADAENARRDEGMETVSGNPRINVVHTFELSTEDPEAARNAMDLVMQEYPETKVVLCHFSSLALAADTAAMSYSQIDREHFGIFSGDWDGGLAARIRDSKNGGSLIRATGTYAADAMELQFHVCTGEYNRLLNDKKQYVFPVVRITADNIGDYTDA